MPNGARSGGRAPSSQAGRLTATAMMTLRPLQRAVRRDVQSGMLAPLSVALALALPEPGAGENECLA
jgi:hypothetical protein